MAAVKAGGTAGTGRVITPARVWNPGRPPARRSPGPAARGRTTAGPARTARTTHTYYLSPAGGRGGAGGGAGIPGPASRGNETTQTQQPGERTYHRIVIAEFVTTVILIATSPFLIPRTSKSGSPASEAESAVKSSVLGAPLVRLTAACIIFFVLALMASGPRTGKIAAAFGGLVTLGAALNTTDMWTALGQVFTGAAAGATGTKSSGSSGSPGAGSQLGQEIAQGADTIADSAAGGGGGAPKPV